MVRMIQCGTCSSSVLELIEGDCETCFKKSKVQPLVDLRASLLKEVSRVDGLLTVKLEKLARSSRHNLNMSFTCECGGKYKTGLDLIAHLPDCSGPTKPQTHRNGFHAKLMKVDIGSITEIG